ncbi:hypothetical protein [Streptomyces alboflavus]|uniref:hypothetical protein n=1 Tax=Streptomyces alboflavus TaxID=67267 RepID=UPI00367DD3D3
MPTLMIAASKPPPRHIGGVTTATATVEATATGRQEAVRSARVYCANTTANQADSTT